MTSGAEFQNIRIITERTDINPTDDTVMHDIGIQDLDLELLRDDLNGRPFSLVNFQTNLEEGESFTISQALELALRYRDTYEESIIFKWADAWVLVTYEDTIFSASERWRMNLQKKSNHDFSTHMSNTFDREATMANYIIEQLPIDFWPHLATHTPDAHDRRYGFCGPQASRWKDLTYNATELYTAFLAWNLIKAFNDVKAAEIFLTNISHEFTMQALGGQAAGEYYQKTLENLTQKLFAKRDEWNIREDEQKNAQETLLRSLIYYLRDSDNKVHTITLSPRQVAELLDQVAINEVNFLSNPFPHSNLFETYEPVKKDPTPKTVSNFNHLPTFYLTSTGGFAIYFPSSNTTAELTSEATV